MVRFYAQVFRLGDFANDFPAFLSFFFFSWKDILMVVQASNSYIQIFLLRGAGGSLVPSPNLEGYKAWIPP